jgi:CheY-like chemotaxis protein
MKTILLLEDEPGIAEMLVMLLEHEQFKVVAAANGLEALAALKQSRPDAILTDVMMPFMGGPEFCRLVRSDPVCADIPIVFQTSVEEWAVREHFDDFDAFFLKPYQMKDLLSCLTVLAKDGRAPGESRDPAADNPSSLGFNAEPDLPDL